MWLLLNKLKYRSCLVGLALLSSCWGEDDFERNANDRGVPDIVDARRPLLFGQIKGNISDGQSGTAIDEVKVTYNVFIMGNDGIYKDDVLISSPLPDQVHTFTNSAGNYSFGYQTVWINPGDEQVELMIDLECTKPGYTTLNPFYLSLIHI